MHFVDLISGISHLGDEIKVFRSSTKSDKYIYLMAGVHGDEIEGVYVLKKLINYLSENEKIELPLIIIPILNVDGVRTQTRVNAKGVDLNRNLPSSSWSPIIKEKKYHPGEKGLSEPENLFLDKLFKKFPPKLIISFHSWKPIVNYNGDCLEVANFLAKFNNYPVTGDIGYSTPGSLGDYAPEEYSSPVITFECPTLDESGLTLSEIWEQNKSAFTKLLNSNLIKNWK